MTGALAVAQPTTAFDEQVERLNEAIRRGLGTTIVSALDDPLVEEVILNPDGSIWIVKAGVGKYDTGEKLNPTRARNVMNIIASMLDTTVDVEKPILEGNLPINGARFAGVIPPVTLAPAFNIRKKAIFVYTLDDYVKDGILPVPYYSVLLEAVRQRKNILVVGSTASGKTTFLNAVIAAIAKYTPDHRIIVIEDTAEIQCTAADKLMAQTTANVSMLQILKASLRWRPDRIIVGEVRGHEANALLKAWNTGHDGGLGTIHANSCREGLLRVEQLIEEGGTVVNRHIIASAINLVVFITKDAGDGKRKVKQVAWVDGYDATKQEYILRDV